MKGIALTIGLVLIPFIPALAGGDESTWGVPVLHRARAFEPVVKDPDPISLPKFEAPFIPTLEILEAAPERFCIRGIKAFAGREDLYREHCALPDVTLTMEPPSWHTASPQ